MKFPTASCLAVDLYLLTLVCLFLFFHFEDSPFWLTFSILKLYNLKWQLCIYMFTFQGTKKLDPCYEYLIEKKILAKIGLGHQKHIYENKILTKIGLRQQKSIYDPETYVLDILHGARFYKIIRKGHELLMSSWGDRLVWVNKYFEVGLRPRGHQIYMKTWKQCVLPIFTGNSSTWAHNVWLYITCEITTWVCRLFPASPKFLRNKTSESTWSMILFYLCHHRHQPFGFIGPVITVVAFILWRF